MLLSIGQILYHQFRIKRLIGSGGMAEVYQAFDQHRNHDVAIKVLFPHLAQDEKISRRFLIEAKTLEILAHDNIVRFYGFQNDDQLAFLVMEYVEGSTLADVLRTRRFEMPEVWPIIQKVALALNYAHINGVVHRDVKPANILIKRDGSVKVSDFGIARIMGEASLTTRLVGTQYYMSPEQCQYGEITPKSDVFSLGVVLYEMLTGHRPFTGERLDPKTKTTSPVLWEILHLEPLSPRTFNLEIPEKTENIILKCLNKDASQRYSTAHGFIETLMAEVGSDDGTIIEPPIPIIQNETSLPGSSHEHVTPQKKWLWIGGLIIGLTILGLLITRSLPLISQYQNRRGTETVDLTLNSELSASIQKTLDATQIIPTHSPTENARIIIITATGILPAELSDPTLEPIGPTAEIAAVVISTQVPMVNLRQAPGVQRDVVDKINDGEAIEIIDGPIEKDGLYWWKVVWMGKEGWVADHTSEGKTIIRFTPSEMLKAYYASIQAGYFEKAWSMLSENYQKNNNASGFQKYKEFWMNNQNVTVGLIQTVELTPIFARLSSKVRLDQKCEIWSLTLQFFPEKDEWLVEDQTMTGKCQ